MTKPKYPRTYVTVLSPTGCETQVMNNVKSYTYDTAYKMISLISHYPNGTEIYWGAEPFKSTGEYWGYNVGKLTDKKVWVYAVQGRRFVPLITTADLVKYLSRR